MILFATIDKPARFSVYNLDPFVCFVHERPKLSGYVFLVDDDTADVGAPRATVIRLDVGGLNGLISKQPWSFAATFGPVSDQDQIDSSLYPNRIFDLPRLLLETSEPARLRRVEPPLDAGLAPRRGFKPAVSRRHNDGQPKIIR